MPLPSNIWRDNLQPASFRGAGFYCEVYSQAGGRRNVLHEFPLRDIPFCEDMGRRAERFVVTAYVIGPYYQSDRDTLIQACEVSGAGTLMLPSLGPFQVNCDSYNSSETKEKGGMAIIEMAFSEAGNLDGFGVVANTAAQALSAAQALGQTSMTAMQSQLGSTGTSGALSPSSPGTISI